MRTILKIIAAPFVLALILIVAVLTFLSCVAGANKDASAIPTSGQNVQKSR